MPQGNKSLAPGDAHRREQKKKEIAKNKALRKTHRDETLKTADVGTIKAELANLDRQKRMGITTNEKTQRMKLLEAALASREEQRKSEEAKPPPPATVVPKVKTFGALQKTGLELVSTGRGGAGLGERRPQDSVYYHPTLNPTGRPPPGKPQKYKAVADCDEEKKDGDEEDDDEEEIDEEFGFGGFGLPLAGTSTRPRRAVYE